KEGSCAMPQERIDKLIASQGALSRSDVRRLVKSGAIALNGSPVRDAGQKADPEADQITVSGRPLFISKYLYLMLDKPAGIVSASRDAEQKTVIDLVPSALRRDGLFPAGRLDKDTTGFVLITNDGEFAHRILSPKKHISKTYLARLARPVDGRSIEAFRSGLVLADGTRCMEAGLQILEDDETPLAEVVLHEGRYHQIKRMFAALGNEVIALRRVKMGDLPLDETLGPGGCRKITAEELQKIIQAVNG
uniref:pseudouridine synthase n=2 Tax=Candidatus Fimivicinus sp. TaxID=3056640 RepID=UPI003FF07F52